MPEPTRRKRQPKVLPTGRTVKQELHHKVAGVRQIVWDIEHLYPRRVKAIAWSIPVLVVLAIAWRYYSTQNHRLLTGVNLRLGHQAFDSIRDADGMSEDLRAPADRRKAFTEAETDLSVFQQNARTPEELHAGTILSYYLDEVRQIPDKDLECAAAMATAQSMERQSATPGVVTREQLNVAEVGELTCMSARSTAMAIKNVCRDEALSYLIPNRQPPVDYCIFRHGTQTATTH